MPDTELAKAAANVTSPENAGFWGAISATIITLGTVAISKFRNRNANAEVLRKLNQVLESLGQVEKTMATREDVATVHERMTNHLEAHAEGRFMDRKAG